MSSLKRALNAGRIFNSASRLRGFTGNSFTSAWQSGVAAVASTPAKLSWRRSLDISGSAFFAALARVLASLLDA
ncbi:hypothetical protein RS75_22345 [Rhizobium nepotum 39/7]|uniref:Transposase n=1 Tax=Rhizobium nepotum 39/7 TaxID=1368418 RepID=A0ABR5CLN0_9HYPH|nr:hypothetical protein RS75_22345 [Rhizobium nepotum 39/7]